MAGGLNYGHINTAIPGIFVVERIADTLSNIATKGVLAIVGEFPALEQGKVYAVTSDSAMRALAPGDITMDMLSDVVFRPSTDAGVGAPNTVRLISATPVTQASAIIPEDDDAFAPGITLTTNVWGPRGNSTRVTIAPKTGGGFTISVSNGGVAEVFSAVDASNVFKLAYDYSGFAGTPNSVWGFTGGSGMGSGTVTAARATHGGAPAIVTRFSRVIPATAVNSGEVTWVPNGPVNGPITIDTTGGTLGAAATKLTATITGVDSATGLATSEVLVLVDEVGPPVVTPGSVTSATSWSSVMSVVIAQDVLTDPWVGNVTVTGFVFAPYTADAGFASIADVIADMNTRGGAIGFSAVAGSEATYDLAIADLDPSADYMNVTDEMSTTALFSAVNWSLVSAINANSYIVSAVSEAPVAIVEATSFTFSGGTTVSSPATDDWAAAFDELRWYNINVVAVMSTSATIHALLDAHLKHMMANGANERQGWAPTAAGETYAAGRARALALNSSELSLVPTAGTIRSRLGTTLSASPLIAAANLAALQCSVPAARPINGHSTRFAVTTHGWDMAQLDDVIRAGLTPIIATPGDVPRVVRHVTTWVRDTNLCLTEGSARESSFLSYRDVRSAIRAWQRAHSALTEAATAALRPVVASRLEAQSLGDSAIIFGFDETSINLNRVGAVSVVDYTYSPVLPNLWGLVRPSMAPQTATVTI